MEHLPQPTNMEVVQLILKHLERRMVTRVEGEVMVGGTAEDLLSVEV